MRGISITGLLAALLLFKAGPLPAEELPLWEAGIGVLPSNFPAYRGSDEREQYFLPFPYLIYRGEILRVDRDGIRARLFDSDRIELNISLGASLPAKDSDDTAREGMPDLDPTVEIGPSLNILLAQPTPQQKLKLRLPVRAVVASDFGSADHIGWLFHPNLNFDVEKWAGEWSAGMSVGPLFATGKYHEYYYEVAPQYATPTRPVYAASGGYSGTAVIATFSRHFDRIWLGGFARYDYLGGAAFEDSPLVETDHSLMAGVAVAWKLRKSSRTVPD